MVFEEEIVNFKTNFMEIVDVSLWESFYKARYHRDQLNQITHALPLHIIQEKGIEVNPDFNINITDLNTNASNTKFKHFKDNGDGGITFKIEVIIKKGESWGYGKQGQADFVYLGKKYPARARITVWLNHWYVHKTPLYVVSDAIDIPNGMYLITANASRKQNYRDYTVWELEFTTYNPLNTVTYDLNQSIAKITGQKTVKKDTKNTKLSNCDVNLFIYSTTKKNTTQCTRWLQEKLYQLGFLPTLLTTGWYDDEVMNAVKRFQEKWGKYYNLSVTGKMDNATLKAITSL